MRRARLRGPGPREQEARRGRSDSNLFYMTKLCKFHMKGQCTRGASCCFAHGEQQLRPAPDFFKTRACIDFIRTGRCEAGDACTYAHSLSEIRRPGRPARVDEVPSSGEGVESLRALLGTMQAQTHQLQARLEALQVAVDGPDAAPGAGRLDLPALLGTVVLIGPDGVTKQSSGLLGPGMSRQSTGEPEDTEGVNDQSDFSYSRQISGISADLVAEGDPRAGEPATGGGCAGACAPPALAVSVKNTFVHVSPFGGGEHRRADSAPPLRAGGHAAK